MKKRWIGMMIALSMVVLSVAGCKNGTGSGNTGEEQPTSNSAQLESGDVVLNVWAEETTFETMQLMIDSFLEAHKGEANFTINLVAQGDSDTKDVVLRDVHAAGDIFSFPDDQFAELLAAGVLAPIDDQDMVKAEYKADAVASASYNGTVYAIPYTADNGYFLYYDKHVLTVLDVATMDDLLKALNKAGKKMSMDLTSGWYLYSFFGLSGLEVGVNEDGVTNHCNWNATDTAIKGVDIAQAIADILADPAFVAQSDAEFMEGVKNGTIAAGISGTWNAVAISEYWSDDYGAIELPTYTVAGKQVQMSSFKGFKMMGVNEYSEHKGWAMELCKWLNNEENQILRLKKLNQGPANIVASESDDVSAIPSIYAVSHQAKYATLQRVGGKYWAPCTNFANTLIAGNPMGIPLQELMDELVAGITASTAE